MTGRERSLSRWLTGGVVSFALVVAACSDENADAPSTTSEPSSIAPDPSASTTPAPSIGPPEGSAEALATLVDTVIVPGYEEMVATSGALAAALDEGCRAGGASGLSPEDLEAARELYRSARQAWRSTLGFRVGPAMKHRLMPAVDFPVDAAKIEELIIGAEPIDVELVGSQGSDKRGLGAVEAVLFSPETSTMAATDPARRCAYAAAAAALVRDAADRVLGEWADHRAVLLAEPADAVGDLVNETIFTVEGVVDGTLATALGITAGEPDPAAADVAAADPGPDQQALADAVADLDGVLEVYDTLIGPLASSQSAEAAQRTGDQLRTARDLLAGAPEPLAEAVTTADDDLVAAHAALDSARISLETEIASLLGVTLTFSDNDGDS